MTSTSSLQQPRDFQGLPLATLVALLATVLAVSVLSSYDAEARWLRFGMLLFAVGLAMWLPYGWAALASAALSLATAYARGGFTDVGVLRPETMWEVPGVALSAALAAQLRRQLESPPSAPVDDSRSGAASAGHAETDVGTRTDSRRGEPASPDRELPLSRGKYGVRGVRLARTGESWAFVTTARTALTALELELQQTRVCLGNLRVHLRAR